MLDSALRVVLGTMTFAGQTSQRDAATMLRTFLGAGHVEIDTARMYMSGDTESCIGAIFEAEPPLRRVKTSTKANAFQGYDKSLDAASVEAQMQKSKAALRGAPVQIYYLHNPDGATPILETLEAVDALQAPEALLARRAVDGTHRTNGLGAWMRAMICGVTSSHKSAEMSSQPACTAASTSARWPCVNQSVSNRSRSCSAEPSRVSAVDLG